MSPLSIPARISWFILMKLCVHLDSREDALPGRQQRLVVATEATAMQLCPVLQQPKMA